MNFDTPPVLDWVHIGLQFQIEHHLFPRLPRHNLREARSLVKEVCRKHNIRYHEPGFFQANIETLHLLAPRSAAARSSARPVALPAALPALEPLQCPHGPWNAPGAKGDGEAPPWPGAELFWRQILASVMQGMDLTRMGDAPAARHLLAEALLAATGSLAPEPRLGFTCSLGVAALYRVLALISLKADPPDSVGGGHRLALRYQHLATVWVTHELNVEMHSVQQALAKELVPRQPQLPHSFRDPKLSIGIASVCAYPSDNPLPRLASSNHRTYAKLHGYRYRLQSEIVAPERPPAWGKEPDVDWWLWFDCDTFFMNMTVTIDSLLWRYGATNEDVHFLAAEEMKPFRADAAMLNTGSFLLRGSDWSKQFLQRVWGTEDSVWIRHPWWENAAIIWDLLRGLSERFRQGVGPSASIYPEEVRILPQFEMNSYHPATAQSLHDAWAPGKFVLAFNGVLSNTSPNVVRALYGYYYELACELNGTSAGSRCPTRTTEVALRQRSPCHGCQKGPQRHKLDDLYRAMPPKRDEVQVGDEKWKVPFWQEPVKEAELAKHEDGTLSLARREGYLQKRAGKSRFRWTIRFFELTEGQIRWWRPSFKDQLTQPRPPQVIRNKEPRPKPVRCLDLTQLKQITRTKVRFPYSTRILLQFNPDAWRHKCRPTFFD
eukprot:g1231.t1